MMTELDYINMLPDISKFQDVNESSFLKSSPAVFHSADSQ